MTKIITVWGSPGSGKSMFCCILAKMLADNKQQSMIVNTDTITPMLPIWLPMQAGKRDSSIGKIFTSENIDTRRIASQVNLVKEAHHIALLAYNANENQLSYPQPTKAKAEHFIQTAATMVDYLILDCGANISDSFTLSAIESADLTIRIITADLKGLHYFKANEPLLCGSAIKSADYLTFAGLARPFHAFQEVADMIGGFDGVLPYGKEVERCAVKGKTFDALRFCNSKYALSLRKISKALNINKTE